MAIGIDHVQFSVPQISRSVQFLEARGWRLQFEQADFVTSERPYFRLNGKSMAYLKRSRSAIELIDGSTHEGPANWTAVFSARLPGTPANVPRAAPEPLLAVHVPELGATCLCRDDDVSEVTLDSLILESSNPEASVHFLESLGFRRESSPVAVHLRFPADLIGMPLQVSVVPIDRTRVGDFYVDDLGLSLVALISKNLEVDLETLARDGHRISDVFSYSIDGRPISNALVHGPGGERVELLEFGRA